jgi:hypothetical protein
MPEEEEEEEDLFSFPIDSPPELIPHANKTMQTISQDLIN